MEVTSDVDKNSLYKVVEIKAVSWEKVEIEEVKTAIQTTFARSPLEPFESETSIASFSSFSRQDRIFYNINCSISWYIIKQCRPTS